MINLVLRIIVFLFSLQISIEACSCLNSDIIDSFNSTELVFSGIPVNKKEVKIPLSFGESIYYQIKYDYDFKITNILKGNQIGKIQIRSGSGGGDCGYNFEIDKEYLVFADHDKDYWITSICTHNSIKENFDYEEKMLILDWHINPAHRIPNPMYRQINDIIRSRKKIKLPCNENLRSVLRGKTFYFVKPTEFNYYFPIKFMNDDRLQYSDYDFKKYKLSLWKGKCSIFIKNENGKKYRLILNSQNSITPLEINKNSAKVDEEFLDGLFYSFPSNITILDISTYVLYNKYSSKKGK